MLIIKAQKTKSCRLSRPRRCCPPGELQLAVPWQRPPGNPHFHNPQQIYPKTANNSVFTSLNKKSFKPLPVSYSDRQQIHRETTEVWTNIGIYFSSSKGTQLPKSCVISCTNAHPLHICLIASHSHFPKQPEAMNSATRTMQRQPLLSPLHTGKPDRTDSNPSAFIFCTSFVVAPPLLTPSFPHLLFFQAESCLFQSLLAQQLFHTSAPTLLVNFPGTVRSP